ncbi:pilus assembly protein [Haloferax namakaokahaiae]|uniref:Pilus assembly protein n=1 Tax=Haloferax namakaokahaiae TaxID=1748331 RepID=A0ABD5ZGM0_9EURY
MTTLAFESVLPAVARLAPVSADPSDELQRSLSFLDANVDAETVVQAGYGAALVGGVLVGLCSAFVVPPLSAFVAALAAMLVTAHAVHVLPVWLAALERTQALGSAPALVGRLVLRMRVEPSVERATLFAARSGDGPLSSSLATHVEHARGSPRTGLGDFAAAWRSWFPALDRAAALVETAADAPAGERDRALDRAHEIVREGTRDQLASFTSEVRGPVTAVYAFGVLLPLALVGALPAARIAGIQLSVVHVALLYDVVLPVALVAAIGWVLARRPVAFAPVAVDTSHPAVADHRLHALVASIAAAAAGFVGTDLFVASWAAPLAALGLGVGSGMFVVTRPVVELRDRVRGVEDGLSDVLYLVGRAINDGEAVESALVRAATSVPGATGELFEAAVGVQNRLRVGVVESFSGEYGVLNELPSQRVASVATLLGLAASEGRPAGHAIVAMADQLAALNRLDLDARRELASITETLSNTGSIFGPLVAGATVALADGMGPARSLDSAGVVEPLATADLGLVVGSYVLLSAVILTTLSVGVAHGLDRSLVAHNVGKALVSATTIFLAAFVAAGTIL